MEKTWEYSALMRLGVIFLFAIWLTIKTGAAADREVSYYYPASNNMETYKARMRTNIKSDRFSRIKIVNMISAEFNSKSYPSRVAIFAKGSQIDKIIIISLVDGYLDTIYRARALLQTMAPVVRNSPLFRDIKEKVFMEFLDLLKISGFKKITVSDGKNFSYQVNLR